MILKNFPQFTFAKRNAEDIELVESISVVDYAVLQTHLDKTTFVLRCVICSFNVKNICVMNFVIRECVSRAKWLLIRESIALVENLT